MTFDPTWLTLLAATVVLGFANFAWVRGYSFGNPMGLDGTMSEFEEYAIPYSKTGFQMLGSDFIWLVVAVGVACVIHLLKWHLVGNIFRIGSFLLCHA
ncbi:hypothetical protein [Corynebacterium cystitidis]|uniref:hypothetical protein n=1 Tax=Corynebacterium cystitidis TaxID=35757 RepID=UPI00211E56DA|nr:hypothetical protein [Corynebacterium cystitidis]